jgi:hypothetical protein
MSNISRNDPCPCGSGQKFKKCCLNADETKKAEHRKYSQVEEALSPRLVEYAMEVFGMEALQEAWKTFIELEDNDPPAPDSPINSIFIPWFIFNSEFEDTKSGTSTTIAESFWEEHESNLTDAEIEFLDAACFVPYTLCEVLEVKPNAALRLQDLFTCAEYEVYEHAASKILSKGEIIYCAPIELDTMRYMLALGPWPLQPKHKQIVLDLRQELVDSLETKDLTDDDVIEIESEIRTLYFGLLFEMLDPMNANIARHRLE